jgi:1-acyl-sn-glycerol-3-phosphate acyltransferase
MKNVFLIVRMIFFITVAVAVFFVGTLITILFVPFFRKRYRPFMFSARLWAKLLMFLSGSKVTIKGISNVPKKGGYIFASNHQGALDILIHLAYVPRYFRFVAKKSLFDIPIFGWYMSLAGYVPIERDVAASAHRTMNGVAEVLSNNECILIYPEGTRSKTGELGPFKRGSLMAAFQSGASVIPVAISGSYQMMPKNTYLVRPSKVQISFGKPIDLSSYKDKKATKEDYEKELARLRSEIEGLLNE